MHIKVEAFNAKEVVFWKIPTGTNTWELREFLFVDKNGTNGWSYTLEYGEKELLHHHIEIHAIGYDGKISKVIFQIQHH